MPGAQATERSTKILPLQPKDVKKLLKPNKEYYTKVAAGLHIVPPVESYLTDTKSKAEELLKLLQEYEEEYKSQYEATENKRQASLKPRLCDKRLTDYLSNHFKRALPDFGKYGVCDLNRLVPRAISLIVKEKGLCNAQYFTLDDELADILTSPSVSKPEKTYIQLARERIDEIKAKKDYKTSLSSAEIIEEKSSGKITMNYSALKIVTPKFGIDYNLDPTKYIPALEDFAKKLDEESTKFLELKKTAKTKKTK